MKQRPFEYLYPLTEREEYGDLEQELKNCFLEVYKNTLAPKIERLNTYGMPHLSELDLLKKWFSAEWLNYPYADGEQEYLSYLLKAWKVKNPKRGFHFLHTFLRAAFGNNFEVSQQWQGKEQAYPTDLRKTAEKKESDWLTSRILIEVTDSKETGDTILKLAPIIRSIIAARFLVELKKLQVFELPVQLYIGNAASVFQTVKINGKVRLERFRIETQSNKLNLATGLSAMSVVSIKGTATTK